MSRVVLLVALSVLSRAATYSVSTTGADSNPGTAALPVRTLQRAVDMAAPGDTIVLTDGVYGNQGVQSRTQEGDTIAAPVNIAKSGTPGAYITIRAEHKWGAVLDCGNDDRSSGCDAYINLGQGAAYIVIQDLLFTRAFWGGIWDNADGHHITIRGCRFQHIGRHPSDSAQGMAAVYAGPSTHDLLLDGNLFHDIGRTAGRYCDMNDHALYLKSADTTVVNNIFYAPISGWGVQTASGFSGLIANNTFSGEFTDTRPGHIVLWGNTGGVVIRNNIFNGPRAAALHVAHFSPTACSIDTNIIAGPGVTLSDGSLPSGCLTSDNRAETDVKFVAPAAFDFHLRPGSAAIGAGRPIAGVNDDFDGAPRPPGRNCDIGAYQFQRVNNRPRWRRFDVVQ